MKNEKVCFNKQTGIIALVGILLIISVFITQKLTTTQTSTSSRASAPSAGSSTTTTATNQTKKLSLSDFFFKYNNLGPGLLSSYEGYNEKRSVYPSLEVFLSQNEPAKSMYEGFIKRHHCGYYISENFDPSKTVEFPVSCGSNEICATISDSTDYSGRSECKRTAEIKSAFEQSLKLLEPNGKSSVVAKYNKSTDTYSLIEGKSYYLTLINLDNGITGINSKNVTIKSDCGNGKAIDSRYVSFQNPNDRKYDNAVTYEFGSFNIECKFNKVGSYNPKVTVIAQDQNGTKLNLEKSLNVMVESNRPIRMPR